MKIVKIIISYLIKKFILFFEKICFFKLRNFFKVFIIFLKFLFYRFGEENSLIIDLFKYYFIFINMILLVLFYNIKIFLV